MDFSTYPKNFRSLFLFSLVVFFSAQIKAEIVVITHTDSELRDLDNETVRAYYLGNLLVTGSGTTISVGMHATTSSIRQEFDRQVLGIEPEQLHSRWSGLVFSGKASMPELVNNDKEMLEWVQRKINSIGYIDEDNLTEEVKLLYRHSR